MGQIQIIKIGLNNIMKNKKIINIMSNFVLYAVTFLLIYFIKRRGIEYSQFYLQYFSIYLGAWCISSLLSRKFIKQIDEDFSSCVKPNISFFFIMLGILAYFSFRVEMIDVSRMVLLLSLTISFSIELAVKIIRYNFKIKELFNKHIVMSIKIDNISTFIWEFLLLTVIIIVMTIYYLPITPSTNYIIVYAIIYFSWLISAFYTHHFNIIVEKNYFKAIYPHIKSIIFFMSIMSFNLFILRLHHKNQIIIIDSLIIYNLIFYFIITFIFIIKHPKKTDEVSINYFTVNELMAQNIIKDSEEQFQNKKHEIISNDDEVMSFKEKLKMIYLRKYKELYQFIEKSLKLSSIQIDKTEIIRSNDPYNIEILPDNYLELFMNLHELNDQRRINKYFININKKLQIYVIYFGLFEPNAAKYSQYLKKYPYFVTMFFYTFDFIWKRIFPKLPILQKIYFLLSNGRNRAISKAEGLGRLYYCGFDVVAVKQLDNKLYFI